MAEFLRIFYGIKEYCIAFRFPEFYNKRKAAGNAGEQEVSYGL